MGFQTSHIIIYNYYYLYLIPSFRGHTPLLFTTIVLFKSPGVILASVIFSESRPRVISASDSA